MAPDAEPAAADPAQSDRLALLAGAETALAGMGKTFNAEVLIALRTLVAGCPDLGAEGSGEVAASLFMLLDRLIAGGRFDREALAVHIRAWRLTATTETDAASRAALLSGLKQIRDLYADAQAA
jgi:hypothetical protein